MSTLKKIDPSSAEGADASLISLWDVPTTMVAVEKTTVRHLLPISTITQDGPYVFRVWSDNQFLDMSRTWLYLRTSIEYKDTAGEWQKLDTSKEPHSKVSVSNNFGHSFVRSLKMSVNGTECFDSGNLYSYRAYILQELFHSRDVRRSLYEASIYAPDDAPQTNVEGSGFQKRAERFKDGNIAESLVRLDFDLARQNKLFLNNCDIIFTIHKQRDDFLILAPDYKIGKETTEKKNDNQYRIKVHDVQLWLTFVSLTQALNNAIAKQLEIAPARYPLRKIEVRNVFLNKGRTHLAHNLFVNTMPRRVIIAFCNDEAFAGHQKKSPFEFKHNELRTLSIEANGMQFPATSYMFGWDGAQWLRAYYDMYAGLGLDESDRTNSLTMERYLNGWCFFVIPMQSTLQDYGQSFELIRNSTTQVKLQFWEPLKESIEMVAIGEFDSVISIDHQRVLSSDASIV